MALTFQHDMTVLKLLQDGVTDPLGVLSSVQATAFSIHSFAPAVYVLVRTSTRQLHHLSQALMGSPNLPSLLHESLGVLVPKPYRATLRDSRENLVLLVQIL